MAAKPVQRLSSHNHLNPVAELSSAVAERHQQKAWQCSTKRPAAKQDSHLSIPIAKQNWQAEKIALKVCFHNYYRSVKRTTFAASWLSISHHQYHCYWPD